MNSEYGWYGQNGLEACSCYTTFLNTSLLYILTFPMLQISRDVYRKASSTVHRLGDYCFWNVVDAHAQDFVVKGERRVATTHLEIIRSQYVTPKCWLFSVCAKLQLL